MITLKQKPIKNNYAVLGLQFTSMIVTPVLVCVLLGSYIQNKYDLGNWFMNLCIILAIVLIITNLIFFARMAIKISQQESRREKNEDSQRNKD